MRQEACIKLPLQNNIYCKILLRIKEETLLNKTVSKNYTKLDRVEAFFHLNNFVYENFDFNKEINSFLLQMNLGLKESGVLSMLPTYVDGDLTPKQGEKVIVVDAGGTNLRVAVVEIVDNKTIVSEVKKSKLPGLDKTIDYFEFMDILAKKIEPYLIYSKTISFSIAQEVKHNCELDGYVVELSKELNIEGIERKLLANDLKERLFFLGHKDVKVFLINETVGVACAMLQRKNEFSSFIGLVMGTGANSSYIEQSSNIVKIDNAKTRSMFINTESGNYIPSMVSDFDIAYNKCTKIPNTAVFEKMVSGRYLGELFHLIVVKASEYGFFSKDFAEFLKISKLINTEEMSKFYNDKTSENMYTNACKREKDGEILYYICDKLIHRAANLMALKIVALAEKTVKNGAGPICCIVEGSTFYGLNGFRKMVEKNVKKYSSKTPIEIHSVKDAALKGIGNIGLSLIE